MQSLLKQNKKRTFAPLFRLVKVIPSVMAN